MKGSAAIALSAWHQKIEDTSQAVTAVTGAAQSRIASSILQIGDCTRTQAGRGCQDVARVRRPAGSNTERHGERLALGWSIRYNIPGVNKSGGYRAAACDWRQCWGQAGVEMADRLSTLVAWNQSASKPM